MQIQLFPNASNQLNHCIFAMIGNIFAFFQDRVFAARCDINSYKLAMQEQNTVSENDQESKLENIKGNASNRKYKFTMILSIITAAIVLYLIFQFFLYWYEDGIRVADEYHSVPISKQFHVQRKPIISARLDWFDKWIYWRALRKFPTLEYCLKRSARETLDVSQFNWKSIRTEEQAQICLHHVVHELSVPSKVAEWFKKQNFNAEVYVDDVLNEVRIPAYWDQQTYGSYSPFGFFSVWGLGGYSPFVNRGVRIHLTFTNDDKLFDQSEIIFGTNLN